MVALAGLTQSFLGFGFGILAMGVLSVLYADLFYSTALVNLTGIALCLLVLWPLRGKVLRPHIAPLLLWVAPGLFLGVYALISIDPIWLRRMLGLTIVGFALWSLLERAPLKPLPRWWSFPAGFASGALSGAFNMGGPPVIVYFYRQPFAPEEIKASLQAVFLVTGSIRLLMVGAKGLLTTPVWVHSLLCIPGLIFAAQIGIFLSRRLSPKKFRTAVWVLFGLMGGYLLLQA